ncbi:MAG TPA: hypothetical protein VNA30_08025 [Mycobacteriales bacterium]|nr:hypothetical protein [Mycobacteriales bacterium]
MRGRLVATCIALAISTSGCATNPEAELQAQLNAVTEAANRRDAEGLRSAVDAFLDTVRDQGRSGELTSAEVSRLQALAAAVRTDANLIDQALLDTQRRMREADAANKRREAEARAEEQRLAEERAAEERRRAEEDRRRQEEEDKKKKDDDDGDVIPSFGGDPSPSGSPAPGPGDG